MASICKKCNKRITKKGVSCVGCAYAYHTVCCSVTDELFKEIERGSSDWRCVTCRRTSINKSLIIVGRERNDSVSSVSGAAIDNGHDSTKLEETIHELAVEMKSLADTHASTFNSMNAKIDALQALTTKVNGHDSRISLLEKQNKAMCSKIQSLTLQHDISEQRQHANKLQINGIPDTVNEKLRETLDMIAEKLELSLSDSDVHDVYRTVGTRHRKPAAVRQPNAAHGQGEEQETASAGSSGLQPAASNVVTQYKAYNSVTVVFRSIGIRNLFLMNYKKYRNLFLDDEKKIQIYVNEVLTPNRRKLLQKAKLFGKSNNIKYVWIKNGNIFMKKEEGSKAIQINNFTDLAGIWGDEIDSLES